MNRKFRWVTTGLAIGSIAALAACGQGSSGKNRPTVPATPSVFQLPPEFTHTVSPTVTFTASPENAVSPTPTLPEALPPAPVPISAGWNHTCVIIGENRVVCWGSNTEGQLGDGSRTSRLKPVSVKNLSGRALAVAAGWGHTCVLMETGVVKCWGRNKSGELGNGTNQRSTEPVDVPGLTGIVAIAAGDYHTCAVTGQGNIKCWGANDDGQLGDGSTAAPAQPVEVAGIDGVTGIAAGTAHTCARTGSGEVWCWGKNDQGQLGDGTESASRGVPKPVGGLAGGVAALTAKGGHTCVLAPSGTIHCWGVNKFGQLGNGTFDDQSAPSPVTGLEGAATSIAAGWGQTCARMDGGKLVCWGWNFYGQLGEGSTANRNHPVDVDGLNGKVTVVAGGGGHTCAIVESGDVFCWGLNANGQLGNQATVDSSIPVKVVGLSVLIEV